MAICKASIHDQSPRSVLFTTLLSIRSVFPKTWASSCRRYKSIYTCAQHWLSALRVCEPPRNPHKFATAQSMAYSTYRGCGATSFKANSPSIYTLRVQILEGRTPFIRMESPATGCRAMKRSFTKTICSIINFLSGRRPAISSVTQAIKRINHSAFFI